MPEQLQKIIATFNVYGELLMSLLLAMLGGIILIVILYRLVSKLIKPGGKYSRVIKVFFGAIYAMILVVTVIVGAESLGHDLSKVGGIAMLIVIVGAVLIFFLIPFLPRLPFKTGDMVQLKGIMGVVEAITAYQVVLRTFDGQIVYMPTPLVMASPITNYHHVPNRRVDLNLEISSDSDLEHARSILLNLMAADERVFDDPAPAVYITGAADGKVALAAYSWVANADWFGTRDALYVGAVGAFRDDEEASLALPKVELVEQW